MIPTGKDLRKEPHFVSLSNQILKVGAFIYFFDRNADMVRYVLVLEVEYHSILMKAELSITDTVVSAVKCSLQYEGG